MVKNKWLAGVVSMPGNIFAATTTNVSILFIDKDNKEEIILVDASNLGTKVKVDDKNQKTLLSSEEEDKIINTFNNRIAIEDFSVVVSYDEIEAKNHSLSAGQYFEVKIKYEDISPEEFNVRLDSAKKELNKLFEKSKELDSEILNNITTLSYDL